MNKLKTLAFASLVFALICGGAGLLVTKTNASYTPTAAVAPYWVKVTKTFSDFSTAATTNSITIYTLPANSVVHSVIVNNTAGFGGGGIATYTLSTGISGSLAKYSSAASVIIGGATAFTATSATVFLENTSGTTNILATAISTVGNLNAATTGAVTFYILVSQLP